MTTPASARRFTSTSPARPRGSRLPMICRSSRRVQNESMFVSRAQRGALHAAPRPGNATGLQPAEPIVALILPIAAGVMIENGEADDVLGILEAELGRNAHAQRKAVFRRQDFAVVAERQLRLRVQRGGHVDRAGIALRAGEMHVARAGVGADPTQELAQGG